MATVVASLNQARAVALSFAKQTDLWVHVKPETDDESPDFEIRFRDEFQEEGWNLPIHISKDWIDQYFEEEFLSFNLQYDSELGDDPKRIFAFLIGSAGRERFANLIVNSFKKSNFVSEIDKVENNWLAGYFKNWLEENYLKLLEQDSEEIDRQVGAA